MPIMAKRHGKKRDKEEKPSPSEKRISTVDALKRVHEVLCVIMCNTCEKKDTCVVRLDCLLYSDKPPECPKCKKPMEKIDNNFICTSCTLEAMKKERLGELE